MKKYYLFLLFFFAADSFAVIEFTRLYDNNCEVGTIPQTLIGSKHGSMDDAISFFESMPWPEQCKGRPFGFFNKLSLYYKDETGNTGISAKTIGVDGCDFESCKEVAAQQCENEGTTLDQETYVYRSSNDYDSSCNAPPPDEPIKSNEECENLSNNQCNTRGSVQDFTFVDNGDFTYQCNFTCGDGTTGDKNGTLAKDSDGICDPNDPNDLSDCDVSDNEDPNCVAGCGDAYTPDNSNDIEYTADGTNQSDGTGTDNVTNKQADVLINEIIKLKNQNAEQTIKSKDAVVSAVESIDSNAKLDEVITAINNSGGGSTAPAYDDTNLINAVNNNSNFGTSNTDGIIAAINNNGFDNENSGLSNTYNSDNFVDSFLDVSQIQSEVGDAERALKLQLTQYKENLSAKFNLNVTGNGYKQTDLVLSQGTYDISWSRFSQYFASIGMILYALASLIALSIIFQGRM
jgi:hypothetical protein